MAESLKLIFCGTPDFSVPTLESVHNFPGIEIVKVIAQPDRKAGRGQKMQSPPIVEKARQLGLSVLQTENINKEDLSLLNCDVILVLAFAQFLGEKVLALPKRGCFNIHTSLLPKYRGAAPIQYALLNGDTSTGVSIQQMVKKMDAGNIVLSHPVEIGASETGGELYDKLKKEAGVQVKEFLKQLLNDQLESSPQDESQVSFAPVLTKKDGLLNFKDSTFEEIFNRVRALKPWPGTFTFLNNKRLKVIEIEKSFQKLAPGELHTSHNHLIVGLKSRSVRLKQVQLEGKKECSDADLLNGLRNSGQPMNLTEANI